MKHRKFKKLLLGTGILLYGLSSLNTVEAKDVLFEVAEDNEIPYIDVYDVLYEKISKYSLIYGYKYDFVLALIDRYSEILKFDNIESKTLDELEIEVIQFIAGIKKHHKEYDVDLNSDIYDDSYEKNCSIREMVYYYATLYGLKDPDQALAICCFESYYFKHPKHHNPCGLRGSGDFYKFDNWDQGIIAAIRCFKSYSKDGYIVFKKLENSETGWAKHIESMYKRVKKGVTLLDEEEEKLTLKNE